MAVFRAIAGIVVGYVAYAAASMALLTAGMSIEGTIVVVAALVALALIGLVAGWIAAKIAGPKARLATLVAAALVAVATLANLFLGLGAEPAWYKIGTLVLTVPAIFLAGRRFGGAP